MLVVAPLCLNHLKPFIDSTVTQIIFLVGRSHFLFMAEFVKALLDRGHEVTFITIFSLNHLNLRNYTEILINIRNHSDTESKCFSCITFFCENIQIDFLLQVRRVNGSRN